MPSHQTGRTALLVLVSLVLVSLALALLAPVGVAKALHLVAAQDLLSDLTLNEPVVEHTIVFTIPGDGHAVTPSDYIRITLPSYSGVTAPSIGGGWSGAPIFGVSGNIAFITNVSAPAGTSITVLGITATNPANVADFQVTIDIASSLTGGTVFNSVIVDPTQSASGSQVTGTVLKTEVRFTGRTSAGAFVAVSSTDQLLAIGVSGSTGGFEQIINIEDVPAVVAAEGVDAWVARVWLRDRTGVAESTLTSLRTALQPGVLYLSQPSGGQEPLLLASLAGQAGLDPITFTLSAQDTLDLFTAPVDLQPILEPGMVNDAEFVLMPPTLRVFTALISSGDSLVLAGSGAPATDIVVLVDGIPRGGILQTDIGGGFWSVALPGPWAAGDHTVHVINQESGGLVSQPSTPKVFTVVAGGGGGFVPPPVATPTPIPPPVPTPTPLPNDTTGPQAPANLIFVDRQR